MYRVTALGSFDYLVSAQGPIAVGLWTADGTLLASTTITTGSTLANDADMKRFRRPAFAGPDLFCGGVCDLGKLMNFSVADPNNGTVIMAPEIQLGMAVESSASGFNFLTASRARRVMPFWLPILNFSRFPNQQPSGWLVRACWSCWRRRRRC